MNTQNRIQRDANIFGSLIFFSALNFEVDETLHEIDGIKDMDLYKMWWCSHQQTYGYALTKQTICFAVNDDDNV